MTWNHSPIRQMFLSQTFLSQRRLVLGTLSLALFGGLVPEAHWPGTEAAKAAAPRYSKPIVIRRGGVYRGNWESLDPRVPAVTVATAEPVVIENANIRGRGALIFTAYVKADLTVRHTRGVALHPGRPLREHRFPGRFLHMEEFRNARIYNNEMVGTSGMYFRDFQGKASRGQTIKILKNRARNIDGRYSTGVNTFSKSEYRLVQFVQFNAVRQVANVEIAWNEVVNEPGRSRPEELISMYLSSGAASSSIKIHNNYLQGAYNVDPTKTVYSGAGMNLGDGSARKLSEAAGYIRAYENQVVGTNSGIVISSGHNISVYNNRLIASGYLADGRRIAGQNVGLYVWDMNGDKRWGTFFNNSVHHNVVGWATPLRGRRTQNALWFPDCGKDKSGKALCYSNTVLPSPILHRQEKAEWERWVAKLRRAGVKVGPGTVIR